MSGALASRDCALSRPASSGAPAASAEEAFKNARRETPGGIMLGGCCMVDRTVEAISSMVETNSFLSAGSPHWLASSEEVIQAGFRALQGRWNSRSFTQCSRLHRQRRLE